MRWDAWLNEAKNTAKLNYLFIGTGSAALVLASFWGISGALTTAGVAEAKKTIDTNVSAIADAQRTLQAARNLPGSNTAQGTNDVDAFLSEAHKIVTQNGCDFLDCSKDQAAPFNSHFTDAPGDGWTAQPVSVTISGNMVGFISTLKALSAVKERYELLGFDLSRVNTSKVGVAKLSANVRLAILTKSGGT